MIAVLAADGDLTADILLLRARDRGIPVSRISISHHSPTRASLTANPDGSVLLTLDEVPVTGIWCRTPNLWPKSPISTETDFARLQWILALETTQNRTEIRWLNRPGANRSASEKLMQLAKAGDIGMRVPPTLLSNDAVEILNFERQAGPLIMKALHSGSIAFTQGPERAVFTRYFTAAAVESEPATVTQFPAIYQSKIDGPDARVFVVHDEALGYKITSPAGHPSIRDWRHDDHPEIQRVEIASTLKAQAVQLIAAFDLQYGALDFVGDLSSGEATFLEINPGGQWSFAEEDYEITDLILDRLSYA